VRMEIILKNREAAAYIADIREERLKQIDEG
jgi:hypothetical protein